jgi:hypothetical protein
MIEISDLIFLFFFFYFLFFSILHVMYHFMAKSDLDMKLCSIDYAFPKSCLAGFFLMLSHATRLNVSLLIPPLYLLPPLLPFIPGSRMFFRFLFFFPPTAVMRAPSCCGKLWDGGVSSVTSSLCRGHEVLI